MIGRVHSIESFGTVDGPGIRMVIFLSGCPMRCLYCHNPDTWDPKGGTAMTVDEILNQFEQARSFYKKGGITVSGGEPLRSALSLNYSRQPRPGISIPAWTPRALPLIRTQMASWRVLTA